MDDGGGLHPLLHRLGPGSFDNTHIKADLLKEWLKSEAAKRRVDSVIFGLEVLIGAVLSYWAYLMVADDLSRYPDLPATPVYSIPLAVPRGRHPPRLRVDDHLFGDALRATARTPTRYGGRTR